MCYDGMVTTIFVGLSSDLVIEDYLVNIGKLVTGVGSFTPSLLDILMDCDPWLTHPISQLLKPEKIQSPPS